MRYNVFIAEKPLRYSTIRNISGFSTICNKMLIVVDVFNDSESFCRNVRKYDGVWDRVVFVKSVKDMYLTLAMTRVNALYTFVDCSIVLGLFHIFKRMDVYVIEEGIGTYYPQYLINNSSHLYLRKILGVGTTLGSSRFTKGIYVYLPELFLKGNKVSCPVMPMEQPFLKYIVTNKKLLYRLSGFDESFFLKHKNTNILLYLTDWSLNPDIMQFVARNRERYDRVFIKLHPHLHIERCDDFGAYEIIRENVMAELLLAGFLDNGCSVTVCHSGSTSVLFFVDHIISLLFGNMCFGENWTKEFKSIEEEFKHYLSK